MEKLDFCPVCHHSEFGAFISCEDFTVSHEYFEIVQCKSCSFLFTNPRPEASDLGRYYESEEYVSHSNTSKGIVNTLYQFVRKYTLVKKLQLINKQHRKGKLLDIGSGTGEFLSFCKKGGWSVTGIEPNEKARSFATQQYGLAVLPEEQLQNLPNGEFSIITLWHVLEHVPHLNERIIQIKEKLNDTGKVIVAVPNPSSYDANHYKQYWAAYDVPRHLYHFTPDTIEQLFKKHGFTLEQVKPMVFDSFYVSLLSEKYKKNSLQLFRGFMTGLVSNLKGAAANGRKFSSQIYIFKKLP